MKIKLDKNDILFSKMIRERDKYTCVFCKRKAPEYRIECSHFWGRGDKSNRFNPANCDALCFSCHSENEGNKQGKYREFKIKQLGEEKYNEMEKTHYQGYKKYGAFEKKKLQVILKSEYENLNYLEKDWAFDW